MNVYFDKEETEFVRGKGRGFVRGLVRAAMEEKLVVLKTPDWTPYDVVEKDGVLEVVKPEEPDVRDVPVWRPPEVRPPGLRKR